MTFDFGGLRVSLVGADIKLFDFGIGVVTTTFTAELLIGHDFEAYRRAVEGLARGGEMDRRVRPTVRWALERVFEMLPPEYLVREVDARGHLTDPRPGSGQSLWTHRIFHLPVDGEADIHSAVELAEELLPPMPMNTIAPISCSGLVFLPGVGSSVAVHAPAEDPRALLHAIELQNAYWAGAARLDRVLFARFSALAVDARNCGLSALEERTVEVLDFIERTRLFRLTLNSLVGVLSPLQAATWESLAVSWRLEQQLTAVTDKLDALQTLHAGLVADAAARRDNRLNRGVVVFTVFSLAQTVFAAIVFGFTSGSRLDGGDAAQLAITVVVGLICLALVFLLLFRPERARRAPRGSIAERRAR